MRRTQLRTSWRLFGAALGGALTLSAVVTPGPAEASPAARSHAVKTWDRTHGLPQNTVWSIAQSPEGFLWLATQEGIVRFDGTRFKVFDTRNTPMMRSNDITAVMSDRSGAVWIATRGGGLLRYENGGFRAFTRTDGLLSDTLTTLLQDRDGSIWIGSESGGLNRLRNGEFESWTTAQGLAAPSITAMAQAADGSLWIGTEEGLNVMRNGRIETIRLEHANPSARDIRSLHATDDGTVWAGARGALWRFKGNTRQLYGKSDGLPSTFVTAVRQDRTGTLWIGTWGGGLARLRGGRFEPVNIVPAEAVAETVALFEDASGTLWVGTGAGGFSRLTPAAVATFSAPEGLSTKTALAILADRDGSLWAGTYAGGLNHFDGKTWKRYGKAEGLGDEVIISLAQGANGDIWAGTRVGAYRISNGRVIDARRATGTFDLPVFALLVDRYGSLWSGTRQGIRLLSASGRLTTLTTKDGLQSDAISALLESRNGDIWIGTTGGGLSRLHDGTLKTWRSTDGLGSAVVRTIMEASDGSILAGMSAGLVRLKDGRITRYTEEEGLSDNSVLGIVEDASGRLWAGSNRGIFSVRLRDSDDLDAGRIHRLASRTLNTSHGMRSSECNGGVQPAATRTADGQLWFPTLDGVVSLRPDRLPALPVAAPPILESVSANREDMDLRVAGAAGPGGTQLEVHYTSPTLLGAADLSYRYKLDGFDQEWVDVKSRRVAYYTNLPAGHYRFRVAAQTAAGPWVEGRHGYEFTVRPHYYQTLPFYVGCGLLLSALVLAGHRLRISGLRVRERELVEVNARLRAALDAYEASRARYQDLLQLGTDAVFTVDLNWQVLEGNNRLSELTGVPVDELPGSDLRTLIDPCQSSELACLMAQMEAGHASAFLEVTLVSRSGKRSQLAIGFHAVAHESGPAVRGIGRDVTERRALEEQLRQAQKMEAVGRLAGGVAHDFNNLLTAIIGYSEVALCSLPPDAPVRADIEEIRAAGERAASLTGQLLAFSRKQVLAPAVLDLNTVVTELERMLKRVIGEDVRLTVSQEKDLRRVLADKGQLEQVILNLAVNARDAMSNGGRLTIATANATTQDGRPGVAVTVSDTGVGMSKETLSRVFEPFFTTKPTGKGTGLGLATVYGIVTQTGGTIEVRSAVGKGSTFKVLLPATADAPGEQPTTAVDQPPLRAGASILLVEDEDNVRRLAATALRRAGHRVMEASSGAEALELVARNPESFDLLLTDMVMPGMTGRSLSAAVRRQRPDVPVIFVTGYTDDRFGGDEMGGASLLHKPFRPAELVEAVHERLGAGRAA